MDSTTLERERGITILAKNTAIRWQRRQDQPGGHARPRRLRRRGRAGAQHGRRRAAAGGRRRGPDAPDALRAAQGAGAGATGGGGGQQDGPAQRAARLGRERRPSICSSTSAPPTSRPSSRRLRQRPEPARPATTPDALGRGPVAALRGHPGACPAPEVDPTSPLQLLVTTLDYDELRGPHRHRPRAARAPCAAGRTWPSSTPDGAPRRAASRELFVFENLGRTPVDEGRGRRDRGA